MYKVVALLFGAALLAACSGQPDLSIEGTWTLVDGEVDGVGVELFDTHPITLEATDAELAGSSGCNRYTAGYTLVGDEIVVSEAASTMMACEPAEVMATEAVYLRALGAVETVDVGDGLVLTGPGVTLRFES